MRRDFSYFAAFALVALLTVGGCSRIDQAATQASHWTYVQLDLEPDPEQLAADKGQPPEVWCYRTLGQPDCYPTPQVGWQERLINVDPPSKFPQSREAYTKMLAQPAQ